MPEGELENRMASGISSGGPTRHSLATYHALSAGHGVGYIHRMHCTTFPRVLRFAIYATTGPERHRVQSCDDEPSGLEENGRRSRRRRRPIGAAVAARVSDERSEELARQDERQPASRSPRSAVRLVTTGLNGLEEIGREARHHRTTVKIMCLRNSFAGNPRFP